jgi:hypothetical protein
MSMSCMLSSMSTIFVRSWLESIESWGHSPNCRAWLQFFQGGIYPLEKL